MNKKRFRLGKAFSSAFNLIREFPLQMLLPIAIYLVIMLPLQYFNLKYGVLNLKNLADVSLNSILLLYVGMITRNVLTLGLTFLQFMILVGHLRIVSKWIESKTKPIWKDYLTVDFELFGKFLAVALIFGILIFFGFLFFIIPGLIMLVLYNLAPIILIDKHGGIRRSFGRSDALVSGVMWEFLGFILLSSIIIISPIAYFLIKYFVFHISQFMYPAIFIGIFTFPASVFIQLVIIYLYKDLSVQQDEIDAIKKEKIQVQIN